MSKKIKEFPVMKSICFWCGDMKNEILIGTKAIPTEKIKNEVIKDYEPCDSCKDKMEQGITCIEADSLPWSEAQPSMGSVYPSGRWCVVTEAGIKDMVKEGATLEKILEKRKLFIPKELYNQMLGNEGGQNSD